ncbi:diacylglycerol kinase [Actinomycetaceae bacterium WB03_NA08]|uniref:Diacylglycerol kinase n=1 Tax=Scrofimicrobium canadense TaxID=2652290 RepID=A0A6N7VUA1_9ACTO|nr:diacylglycerol kinase family protein [Scrofimicrobium canadense]MSS85357.1 diacylglycerol kinase [Scrofimicrobium canadense]
MHNHLHLLVSSMSARGKALEVGKEVVRILRGAGWDVTVQVTRSSDSIPAAAQNADTRLVGAVGGDGYIAAVAQGLAEDPDRVMVPFPGGRGNDLCRSLGIGTDSLTHAKTLTQPDLENRIRAIDGMWIGSKRQLALGVVSLGIDATANRFANQSRFRSGPLAYSWGAIAAFTQSHPNEFVVDVDGVVCDLPGWVCSISNSGWIGGGINILPTSDPYDGVLEVLQVAPTSKARALPLLAKVLGGRNLDSPLVQVISAREVHFMAPTGIVAMADGDMVAKVPFTVRVAPQVVRVVI